MTIYEGNNNDMVIAKQTAVDGDIFYLINGGDTPKKAYEFRNGNWFDNRIEARAFEQSMENMTQLEKFSSPLELPSDFELATETIIEGRIAVGTGIPSFPDGYLYNIGTDSTYEYQEFDVVEGDVFIIAESNVANKVANWCIYDSEENVLDIYPKIAVGSGVSSTIYNYEIEMPKDAAIFRTVATQSLGIVVCKASSKKYIVPKQYLLPYFGGEYLQHWYEQIYDAVTAVTISEDGDSITQGYEGQNTYIGMRDDAIKKIMVSGGFSLTNLTINNNGEGGISTNEWVGRTEYFKPAWSVEPYLTDYADGTLAYSMAQNPDLLIVGFGMNDAVIGSLTRDERLELFEENYREGLRRIRGNIEINGRPAYGKGPEDLSIVLVTPTNTNVDEDRFYRNWHVYVREIIIKLAEEFKCAVVDMTEVTLGYTKSGYDDWVQIDNDGDPVSLHPNQYSTAYWMSNMAPLIYPIGLQNISIT